MRIGHGFDAHVFSVSRPLILGGVNIPYDRGLMAHSDGDVVIHALCDAILGAAGMGDIGVHFPDDSDAFKDIDSRELLRKVAELITDEDFYVSNVDITIIAQLPRLAPHIDEMKQNICRDIERALQAVNIKATTTEGMGFTGRGEGIAAHAVVLLQEIGA
ncbi:MAG: 2-C-methyl-D-erythritol 2,4-cyclodiphosphate synthase [Gammaproteobacteria bacterium]|nr:MAG: 2-C-methyl-D-erythritol 2,4-cyclodiphosphate synthase [Gammaproteobacteria bacterium]